MRFAGLNMNDMSESGQFVIGPGRRGETVLEGECVVMTIPAAEIDRLRRDLVADLAGYEGHYYTTATDQPDVLVAVRGYDGRVHSASFNGPADARSSGLQSAINRVLAVRQRVSENGEIDRNADISVVLSPDQGTEEGPRAIWPSAVPPPSGAAEDIPSRTYKGKQATAVRAALGPATRDRVTMLPNRSVVLASWTAMC